LFIFREYRKKRREEEAGSGPNRRHGFCGFLHRPHIPIDAVGLVSCS